MPVNIDVFLRRPRRKQSGGARSRNIQSAFAAFAAAHGEDHRIRLTAKSPLLIHIGYALFGRKPCDKGICQDPDAAGARFVKKAACVFGARHTFPKPCKPEPVVNALLQDPARLALAFQNDKVAHAGIIRRNRRRKPCRAAADDDKLLSHSSPPVMTYDLPPFFVTSSAL